MSKRLVFSSSDCTGCRRCELACSWKHKRVFGRSAPLRIVTNDREMVSFALFCHHCRKPLCIELCRVGAIAVNTESGMVCIDPVKCISCGLCLECPLGGIGIEEESGLAMNCDLCQGSPACAESCPTGALRYVLPSDARRAKAMRSL